MDALQKIILECCEENHDFIQSRKQLKEALFECLPDGKIQVNALIFAYDENIIEILSDKYNFMRQMKVVCQYVSCNLRRTGLHLSFLLWYLNSLFHQYNTESYYYLTPLVLVRLSDKN